MQEMWAKLDKIKHTGECTDAGQCSKCTALFMFSNMGFPNESLVAVFGVWVMEISVTRTQVCGQSFAFVVQGKWN